MKAGHALLAASIVAVNGWLVFQHFRDRDQLHALQTATESAARMLQNQRQREVEAPAQQALVQWAAHNAAQGPPPETTPAVNLYAADAGTPISQEEQRANVERDFYAERMDREWSRTSTSRLEAGLGRSAAGHKGTTDVQCRSSICLARYVAKEPSDCAAITQNVVHQSPPYFWEGPYEVYPSDGSNPSGCDVTMFFHHE